MLICYLNCITEVKPGNRTIRIIRKIVNFEAKLLQECLKAMESCKDGRVIFPIILKTLDFLWFEVQGVHKSRSSYEPYVVQEMSFEEGRDELVTKIKIFTAEDFTST